jgi:putative nucleotidyltransferase with HDIG domain
MITREEAFALLRKYLRDDKLIKHSIAVEAIMIKMAEKLSKDKELWGLTGLLHDLDYEYTKDEPEKHAMIASQVLDGLLPEEAIHAIKAHNYMHTEAIPTTTLDKSLIAADAVSGLVIAAALVMPSKKLAEVRVETLINKFNDSSFAKGCSRTKIELCLDAGVSLDAFLALSLKILIEMADEFGL